MIIAFIFTTGLKRFRNWPIN